MNKVIHQIILILMAYVFLTTFIYTLLSSTAYPHDIYSGLTQNPYPMVSCCSGNDCEGVEWSGVTIHIDGSATLYSKRNGNSVLVAAGRIKWDALPMDLEGRVYPAHWCGVKRSKIEAGETAPTDDQPDPNYWTYCAFIAPGGA